MPSCCVPHYTLCLHLDNQLVARETWAQVHCPKGWSVLPTSQLPGTESSKPDSQSQCCLNPPQDRRWQSLPPLWQEACLPNSPEAGEGGAWGKSKSLLLDLDTGRSCCRQKKTPYVEGGKPQSCARDSGSVPLPGGIIRSTRTRVRRVDQRGRARTLRTLMDHLMA